MIRIRIEQTPHGVNVYNDGDVAVTVAPSEMPDETRRYWAVTHPGEMSVLVGHVDVVITLAEPKT